jgi:flagellar basal-body rod modification protein FlgD
MQIQTQPNPFAMSPEAATPTTSNTASSTDSTAASSTDALGNENTFLQLLVAQIKNQDPTQPIDSSTFLTQLAQFSSLEQLIGIRQDLQPTTPATSTTTGSTTGS